MGDEYLEFFKTQKQVDFRVRSSAVTVSIWNFSVQKGRTGVDPKIGHLLYMEMKANVKRLWEHKIPQNLAYFLLPLGTVTSYQLNIIRNTFIIFI